MWTRLGKLLQIAQGDRLMIAALLLQAFCTGIFVGTLELEANTVFLEAFGADRVPFALMVSGVIGILIAAIYAYFSKQLKMRAFGILNLVVVIGATICVVGALHLMEQDYFDFLTFAFSGPLILITLLGFWTTVRGWLPRSSMWHLNPCLRMVIHSWSFRKKGQITFPTCRILQQRQR